MLHNQLSFSKQLHESILAKYRLVTPLSDILVDLVSFVEGLVTVVLTHRYCQADCVTELNPTIKLN